MLMNKHCSYYYFDLIIFCLGPLTVSLFFHDWQWLIDISATAIYLSAWLLWHFRTTKTAHYLLLWMLIGCLILSFIYIYLKVWTIGFYVTVLSRVICLLCRRCWLSRNHESVRERNFVGFLSVFFAYFRHCGLHIFQSSSRFLCPISRSECGCMKYLRGTNSFSR